jgi:hypothetical protein
MTRQCEQRVRRLAGVVVLLGVGLSQLVSPWFLAIAAFAGLNLLQSSFTGICPAEWFMPGCETADSDTTTDDPAV